MAKLFLAYNEEEGELYLVFAESESEVLNQIKADNGFELGEDFYDDSWKFDTITEGSTPYRIDLGGVLFKGWDR